MTAPAAREGALLALLMDAAAEVRDENSPDDTPVSHDAACVLIDVCDRAAARLRATPAAAEPVLHCASCSRVLSGEEIHYYGSTCHKCEGALLEAMHEGDMESAPLPAAPATDAGAVAHLRAHTLDMDPSFGVILWAACPHPVAYGDPLYTAAQLAAAEAKGRASAEGRIAALAGGVNDDRGKGDGEPRRGQRLRRARRGRRGGGQVSASPQDIALAAIGDAGCDCDDNLDGIESADRGRGEHQCLAGKCEHAIAALEAENARLRDELQNTRLSDFSPEVQERVAFRRAYVAAWDAEWRAQNIERLRVNAMREITRQAVLRDASDMALAEAVTLLREAPPNAPRGWSLRWSAFLAAHGGA